MGHDWQAFEARHCATAAYCAVDWSNRCGYRAGTADGTDGGRRRRRIRGGEIHIRNGIRNSIRNGIRNGFRFGSAFPLFLDHQVEDRLSDKDFWSLDSDCHTLVPLSLSCNEIYGDRHSRGQWCLWMFMMFDVFLQSWTNHNKSMISETHLFKSVSECTSSCSSRLGTHTGFLQVDDEWQALCSTLLFSFFDFSILLFTKLFYKRSVPITTYQILSVPISIPINIPYISIPSSIPVSLLALRKQILWGDVCSGGSSRDGRRAAIGRRRVGGDFCFPRALWGGRHWHGKDLAGAKNCEKLRGF